LPDVLPKSLEEALDPSGDLPFTSSLRSLLVRDIASRLYAKGIRKKAEVQVAADEAIRRWGSPLKSQYGSVSSSSD